MRSLITILVLLSLSAKAQPTTPTSNSYGFVFTRVTADSLQVSFNPGNGQSRLAVLRPWSAVTFTPEDSVTYTVGQDLDNDQRVVYLDSGNHIAMGGLQPDTQYHLTVFEFNRIFGSEVYRVPGADTLQSTLPAMMWGSQGNGPGQFGQPGDVAVAPDGSVVVSDISGRIQKFTPGGGFLWEYQLPDQLLDIPGIAIDHAGSIYVGFRPRFEVPLVIKKLNSFGQPIDEFVPYGLGPGEFPAVSDIAIDSENNVYVVGFKPIIEKYDSAGQYLGPFPTANSSYTKIDIDNQDNVYVSDHLGKHMFNKNGVPIRTFGGPESLGGGIDATVNGTIYISTHGFGFQDNVGHTVVELDSTGNVLFTYGTGSPGSNYLEFNLPSGLASNPSGTKLYVCDQLNYRIQVIDITKQNQFITFDSLDTKTIHDPPFGLIASSSSNLPISYTSSNPLVATIINGDSVSIVGAGTTTITARQGGSHQYKPAAPISQLLIVTDPIVRPTIPASAITFSNVLSTQMRVSFTPGNGAKRIVVMRSDSVVNFTPMDTSAYAANSNFSLATNHGNGNRVVMADSANHVDVTGLSPGRTYFVKVYEYNGVGNQTKYRVTGAPSASRATLALPNVFVSFPANNAVNQNVTLNVTSSNMVGAITYTIELDTVSNFISPLVRSGGRTLNFTGLAYGKVYYSRVKTNLSPDYGPVRTFTTATADFFSYLISPTNNATGITLTNLSRSVTANIVIGANVYTIELNTTAAFNGISQVRTGARTQTFTGLTPGTTYYNRVRTELSTAWGQTRQFKTTGAASLTFVVTPVNGAVNVPYSPTVTVSDVGATTYTVELSPAADFSDTVFTQTAASRTMAFTGLAYNTQYFSRAKTELDSAWGPNRNFTTNSPLTYSYITTPVNNAMNVPYVTNITANIVPGATIYTIEANTQANFLGTSIVRTGGRTLNFTLGFGQIYYVRVKTDLLPDDWGTQIRSFMTTNPLAFSYMTVPANNAVGVPYVTNITANLVPGAGTYTIEANTQANFLGTSIVHTGGRTQSFTLAFDQQYFVRVQTDLAPDQWGTTIRSFTTNNPLAFTYMSSPVNGATNVSYVTYITANLVPTATTYIIEANTQSNFLGTSIVKIGSRSQSFTLAHNQQYFVRVQTTLVSGEWGPQIRSFTTGNPQSIAFVASPVQGAINVPTSVSVIANLVSGATSYTIELNTSATFSDPPMVQTGVSRAKTFSGLSEATTYYSRVTTNLTPGLWGPSRSFSTVNPVGRQAGIAYVEEDAAELSVPEEAVTVRAFPNPFADYLEVHIQTLEQQPMRVMLTDLTGRTLFQSGDWTTNKLQVIRGEFSPGIYLLELNTRDTHKVIRVMRQ